MDDKDFSPARDHEIHVVNREHITIRGVLNVESFDDQEIVLDTEYGALTVRGEDLHISKLDVEDGDFAVEGLVHGFQYSSNPRARGKRGGRGFLSGLFR